VTFNTAAGVAPSISTATNVTDPSAQSYAGTGLTGPQRLVDALGAMSVDFNYKLHGGVITALNAGLRYSTASRASTR
jgi:anionic cell wall polymer biosynthesis LytR-Cps2A-Psr (LCP) family protein